MIHLDVSEYGSGIKHARAVMVTSLFALTSFAWLYVLSGAGMGMSALTMTKLTLFPHLTPELMTDMAATPLAWAVVVAMWFAMMIGMMSPSVAPLVLIYEKVMRHAREQQPNTPSYVPSVFLVIGYLSVWLAFSLFAASLQSILQRLHLISPMMLWSESPALSATVLAIAGAYQLSPFKHACLRYCRVPVQFLARRMQKGVRGALVLGIRHGAWCVGCCWTLMLLLFVGGVMNVAWMAVLTFLVLAEKLSPNGPLASWFAGITLICWSFATLLV